MASPAAPATMMAEISRVPCRNTASIDSPNNPCWAKNVSKQPSIMPLYNSSKALNKLDISPKAKMRNATPMLLMVMPRNIVLSAPPSYTAIGVPLDMFCNVCST